MAYSDSSDNEMDQEMERVLRDHFYADRDNLRAPGDPWEWLESRMEEPQAPSFLTRVLGAVAPLWQVRPSLAFAGAGVAVVAVVVAAVVWATSGAGGPESPDGLVVAPATEVTATAPPQTAGPTAATPLQEGQVSTVEPQSTSVSEEGSTASSAFAATPIARTAVPTQAAMMEEPEADEPASATPAPNAVPVPTPFPLATAAPELARTAAPIKAPAMMEESEPEEPASATPAPFATPAPSATDGGMAMLQPAGGQGAKSEVQPYAISPSGGGTPPDATFRDYERQPFVAASEDNVSTFSLDTDRTSYHLALNWARSGYEVNPDSVRAEEWLNAFSYEYDPPSGSSVFAITGDLFPHPLDEEKRLARIAFQAPELVDDKPLNVTLVLDASGSMAQGNRVAIARRAAESIRQSLRDEDRIAVVHFHNDVIDRLTVEHTLPGNVEVGSSIRWLQPSGSTNVQAGLNLGVKLAGEARKRRPDAYNYVILMSDGVANVDATDPFSILETAYDPNARNPLRLITIGVGISNYNDLLLEQLAQHGNGWYRYLDTAEQAQATFARDNWLSLSIPFADQTRAQVTWNAGTVERWRIIGYENRVTADENFTQDRKEFAEIYSGAATTVLYELELTEPALSRSNVQMGSVELRWVDPDTGDSRSQTALLSGNPSSSFNGRDGSLAHFGAIVALTADLYSVLSSSIDEAAGGVQSGFSALQVQLRSLDGELGTLDAYQDFSFLLEHITGAVEDKMPPSTPSGYSR